MTIEFVSVELDPVLYYWFWWFDVDGTEYDIQVGDDGTAFIINTDLWCVEDENLKARLLVEWQKVRERMLRTFP